MAQSSTARKTTSSTKSSSQSSQSANSNERTNKPLLRKLFIDSVRDMYWAEKHLVKGLAKMRKAATSSELQTALEDHMEVTETHVQRLEDVFEQLGETARGKKCEAMEGLIEEGQEIIEDTAEDTFTRDVGIIMAAQKVEHYEIASYGSLVHLARHLGEDSVAEVFEEILAEEKETDVLLTQIAESGINMEASMED